MTAYEASGLPFKDNSGRTRSRVRGAVPRMPPSPTLITRGTSQKTPSWLRWVIKTEGAKAGLGPTDHRRDKRKARCQETDASLVFEGSQSWEKRAPECQYVAKGCLAHLRTRQEEPARISRTMTAVSITLTRVRSARAIKVRYP